MRRRGPPWSAYRWHRLVDLNEDDYTRALQGAKVFLATGIEEGSPHAPLEAMTCGCPVVGFNGIGGADLMLGGGTEQNCILVENGNYPC